MIQNRAFGTDPEGGYPAESRDNQRASISRMMPGGYCGKLRRVLGQLITPPDDVEVGSQQQQIAFIDRTRLVGGDIQHRQRRPVRFERGLYRRQIALPIQAQQGKTGRWNEILYGPAIG